MYLTDPTKSEDFLLDSTEQTWVEMQPFLLKRGYRLRPRYDPDWIPSWLTAQVPPGATAPDPTECEDGLTGVEFLIFFMILYPYMSPGWPFDGRRPGQRWPARCVQARPD